MNTFKNIPDFSDYLEAYYCGGNMLLADTDSELYEFGDLLSDHGYELSEMTQHGAQVWKRRDGNKITIMKG